jgi:hypothetical protein
LLRLNDEGSLKELLRKFKKYHIRYFVKTKKTEKNIQQQHQDKAATQPVKNAVPSRPKRAAAVQASKRFREAMSDEDGAAAAEEAEEAASDGDDEFNAATPVKHIKQNSTPTPTPTITHTPTITPTPAPTPTPPPRAESPPLLAAQKESVMEPASPEREIERETEWEDSASLMEVVSPAPPKGPCQEEEAMVVKKEKDEELVEKEEEMDVVEEDVVVKEVVVEAEEEEDNKDFEEEKAMIEEEEKENIAPKNNNINMEETDMNEPKQDVFSAMSSTPPIPSTPSQPSIDRRSVVPHPVALKNSFAPTISSTGASSSSSSSSAPAAVVPPIVVPRSKPRGFQMPTIKKK